MKFYSVNMACRKVQRKRSGLWMSEALDALASRSPQKSTGTLTCIFLFHPLACFLRHAPSTKLGKATLAWKPSNMIPRCHLSCEVDSQNHLQCHLTLSKSAECNFETVRP